MKNTNTSWTNAYSSAAYTHSVSQGPWCKKFYAQIHTCEMSPFFSLFLSLSPSTSLSLLLSSTLFFTQMLMYAKRDFLAKIVVARPISFFTDCWQSIYECSLQQQFGRQVMSSEKLGFSLPNFSRNNFVSKQYSLLPLAEFYDDQICNLIKALGGRHSYTHKQGWQHLSKMKNVPYILIKTVFAWWQM